jgi:glycine cleavage system H protein
VTPDNLRYSQTHEWVRVEGDEAVIGITDHAQSELGDIVFLELPAAGRSLREDDVFGVVESVKAVSDLISPVAGEVTAVNDSVVGAPETVNSDPYEAGWMLRVRLADPAQVENLMTAEQYEQFAGH